MAQRELTSILIRSEEARSKGKSKLLPQLPKNVAEELTQVIRKPQANIQSDLPATKDSLNFKTLVRTLSNIILAETTQTPITIGIDGEWGTGKTSILKMIEAQARMIEFPCIWLNAWSLESTENLITSVASEIQREAKSKYPSATLKDEVADKIFSWMVDAGSVFAAVGSAAFGLSTSAIEDLASKVKRTTGVTKASRERKREVSELASIATTHRSFGELVQILLEDSKYSNPRLIVFIDDIDRALPDQIATILKNLKLVLEIPQCVFVLALDMDIVANSIENYYRSRSEPISMMSFRDIEVAADLQINQVRQTEVIGTGFGYNYLEKLIQVRIEVPSITRETVDTYLEELGIVPEVKQIIHWIPDEEVLNPRRLKRYINWLSISLQLISSLPMPPKVRNVTALQAMALRREYPEIYGFLLKNPPEKLSSMNQHVLESLLKKRAFIESPKEKSIADLIDYLRTLPQNELLEFDKFLRKNPILDMKRPEQRETRGLD